MARIFAAPQHFERRVAGIEYGVLNELVGYALRRAQIAIYEDFESALDAFGITPQRFAALVVIAGNGGISQRMLGRVLGIARSGVVHLVNGLQTRGWVSREVDGGDARAWLLTLTPAGRSHLDAVRRRVRAHDRRVSRSLSEAERVELVGLLDRLGRT
jgi:DNA-binding MarR family transcriptional regulator